MRLADRLDRTEVPPDVDAEREALDAVLRGEDAPEGMEDIATLASDLDEVRLGTESEFAADLDAWAAAGFPRGERPSAAAASGGGGGRDVLSKLSPIGPRGWLPLAATATAVVVVGVSIAQIDFGSVQPGNVTTVAEDEGANRSLEDFAGVRPTVPESLNSSQDFRVEKGQRSDREGARDATLNSTALTFGDGRAGYASETRSNRSITRDQRKVERDAEMTLAAPAGEVPDVTNDSINVIEGARGVILNSRVSGTDGSALATIEAQVPSSKLDSTLARLSDLADVRSRTEQEVDVTKDFVDARDLLVGLRAERTSLANRIEEATTDEEVDALQAQLAGVNEDITDAANDLSKVKVRVEYSTLDIRVTSTGSRPVGGESDDDGWSVGDALDDAGRVLEVAAGVALISAAVLIPLALIASVAFTMISGANRRSRERALDK